MNQPKARLPPNQSPAAPTGRHLQMACRRAARKVRSEYETVLNMKTAKALGLDVSTSILLSADELIE